MSYDFEEIQNDLSKGVRWEEKAESEEVAKKTVFLGTTIEGEYISIKTDVGPNKSTIYEIKLDNGDVVSVWGNGVLNARMSKVPLYYRVRITYLGTQMSKQRKAPYRNFKVEAAKAAMQEVTSNQPQY